VLISIISPRSSSFITIVFWGTVVWDVWLAVDGAIMEFGMLDGKLAGYIK